MTLQFFYDPNGGALCQNPNGLTFYLQGQPPTRPRPGVPTEGRWPSYPGQPYSHEKSAPSRGA